AGRSRVVYDNQRGDCGACQQVILWRGLPQSGVNVITPRTAEDVPPEVAPVPRVEAQAQVYHVPIAVYQIARIVAAGRSGSEEVELLVGGQHGSAGRDRIVDIATYNLELAVLTVRSHPRPLS